MLRTIAAILVLIWLIGVFAHIAGGLIYIALVIAAIIFVYDTFIGRKKSKPTDKKPE